MTDCMKILEAFYPEDTPLRRLLLTHSRQVRDKALALTEQHPELPVRREIVSTGAMLHDIGIVRCHAPGILCCGTEPYIAHGLIGGTMLREYGREHRLDLEVFARISERHTGAGLSAEEIREQNLPIPVMDLLPETLEEKIIAYADKFFSKSGDMQEKKLESIRRGLAKFGPGTMARFAELEHLFN